MTAQEEEPKGDTAGSENVNEKPAPDEDTKNAEEPNKDPKKPTQEEPPKDEEGLLLSYDVILCGTGLVQSILASALTRAGKTVLHCDANDHYGELDTVWTFGYMQERQQQQQQQPPKQKNAKTTATTTADDTDQVLLLSPEGSYQTLKFHSAESKTNFPVTAKGAKVQTPYGQGTVTSQQMPSNIRDYGSLAISLDNWTMADGTHPTVYMGVPKTELQQQSSSNDNGVAMMESYFQEATTALVSCKSLAAQRILQHQSRSLALDVNPCLLYASGQAVQGLLTSNVAEHLEFQTMSAVYWLNNNNKTNGAVLERVPCSKGDVFQSPLLPSPMDKRRFMKFFQSAMDYATERELQQQQLQSSDDSNNDANNNPSSEDNNNNNTEEGVLSLNERQLNQGRSLARPQNKAVSQKDLQTLYDCMEQNMEFETYLQNHAKLSPQLRQLIRHALALEVGVGSGSNNSSSNNENQAMGLSTLEGMGRLCDHLKALGRYGTTAFLTPLYGSGEMSQFFCRSAAVYGATYLLRRVPQAVTFSSGSDDSKKPIVRGVTLAASDDGFMPAKEKHIQATHVVIAEDAKVLPAISSTTTRRRVLRRISVVRGAVVPDASVMRSVIIIPPGGVLQDHKYAIHGLVLDESARVAPAGCNVLHLTTIVDSSVNDDDDDKLTSILDQTVQLILDSAEDADEIYQTTFSYGLPEDENDDGSASDVNGLHVLKRSAMPLIVDEAFEQARTIFHTICGKDEEFLALSEQMEAKLKEQLQDAYRGPNQVEDDTEQVVLDSAMEMMKEEQQGTEAKDEEKKESSSKS